jgi:hypothetical protein
VADAARDMRRMFGLGLGLDVTSDQRLTKARELRHDEEQQAQDEETPEAQASTPAARQRRLKALASVMPWVPTRKRIPASHVVAVKKPR